VGIDDGNFEGQAEETKDESGVKENRCTKWKPLLTVNVRGGGKGEEVTYDRFRMVWNRKEKRMVTRASSDQVPRRCVKNATRACCVFRTTINAGERGVI